MNRPEGNINTAANAVTTIGLALVAKGVGEGVDTPKGLVLASAGRICDLIDGPIARAREEDSSLGALLDASCDKVGCAAIALSMWRKGIVPDAVFAGMAAQNIANGLATVRAQKAHPEAKLLPSRTGKWAMLVQNFALLSYDISHMMEHKAQELAVSEESDLAIIARYQRLADTSRLLGHIAGGVGIVVLGIPATRGYIKRI